MVQKRRKRKAHKPPSNAQLGSANYEGIAHYVQDTLEGSMTTIVSLQTKMKSTLNIRIVELKTLLERATQMPTPTTSTYGTPRGGSIVQGRVRCVHILPTSVRLPSGSPIEQTGFIEVDLAGILTNTLQMVQVHVHEELRDEEVATYQLQEPASGT